MLRAFREDRAMRDAARRLVSNDWRNIRGGLGERGVGERFVGRMEVGAAGLADDAAAYVEDNPGKVGAGVAIAVAAALGWMFRDSLTEKMQDWWPFDHR